ncbi:unnamed protein product [Urochloa humidicola]
MNLPAGDVVREGSPVARVLATSPPPHVCLTAGFIPFIPPVLICLSLCLGRLRSMVVALYSCEKSIGDNASILTVLPQDLFQRGEVLENLQ